MTLSDDAYEAAAAAKDKLDKIRQDPQRALFSDYTEESPDGAVTVRVDLIGRLKDIDIQPNTIREGNESWLVSEIQAAYQAAQKAADYLNFDLAEFARELENAPTLQRQLTRESQTTRDRTTDDRDDDEYFRNPLG